LTVRDSFNAFLVWRSGPLRLSLGLVRMIPAALRYLVDRDRGRIKAAAVRVLLRGTPREVLAREAERFADAHAARLFRPDALEAWRAEKARGALVGIVTASPDLVVEPFARRLGADFLLGTRLRFDAGDRVAGALEGENCRGAEKVRRLRERFGPELGLEAAYGDTGGDREMLAIAARPRFRVFKGRPH
jgi:phosphatidylglycerophosphatase C